MPISCQSNREWQGVSVQGFMRQRGHARELRVYLGRDPVSGLKRWATQTVRGGKREAQRVLTTLVAEADRGARAQCHRSAGALNIHSTTRFLGVQKRAGRRSELLVATGHGRSPAIPGQGVGDLTAGAARERHV